MRLVDVFLGDAGCATPTNLACLRFPKTSDPSALIGKWTRRPARLHYSQSFFFNFEKALPKCELRAAFGASRAGRISLDGHEQAAGQRRTQNPQILLPKAEFLTAGAHETECQRVWLTRTNQSVTRL